MKRVLHLVSVIGLAVATPSCVVRGTGTVGVEGTTTVYSDPPPPQVETYQARPGFVWVKGHYVWRNGQWTWTGGHWERERAGYAWTDGRWEHRGNAWVWVDGTWAVSSQPAAQGGVVVTPTTTTTTGQRCSLPSSCRRVTPSGQTPTATCRRDAVSVR